MTVCLSMIVKNEASRLETCLASVQDFVDEMVIVDTGSDDDTVAIAERMGAKVVHFEWCDDFAAARNYGLQWVNSEWIFILDADEVLIPEAKPFLMEAMQNPDTLVINYLRQEVGATQTPLSLLSRVFRRHPKIQFRRPYHELIDDSVVAIQTQEPHWQVESLSMPVVKHFGYGQELLAEKGTLQRAQVLIEKGIAQDPDDIYLYSKLGGVYYELKQYSKAKKILEQGIALVKDEPAVSYELWFHLGLIQKAEGDIKAAESAYQQAIAQQYPDLLKLGAYLNLGSLYLDYGVFPAAQTLFEHCVKFVPDLAIAHYNLGLAYKSQNQLQPAIDAYQQAIAMDPNYAMAHQNLGVVFFKLGRMAESQSSFQRAIALYEKSDSAQAQKLRTGMQELGIDP